MRALIFHGPGQVKLENRPIPRILDPRDAIIKVERTALCGSELHVFRGHQKSGTGFVMGHEFVGRVVEVGEGVRGLEKGMRVVCPFTSCW